MSTEIQDRLLNYWGLQVKEAGAIYREYGIPETVAALEYSLSKADNLEKLGCVCCFLRDSVIGAPIFFEALDASNVAAIMGKLLLDGPRWMRFTLVYTMKIGLTGHGPIFWEAFYKFRDTDPIVMPNLLGEASWTRSVEGYEMHWLLLESPSYLSRWAVANCTPDISLLEKMQADPHPRVQREADYLAALWHRDQTHEQFTKLENRQRRKAIEATKPLTFFEFYLQFQKFKRDQNSENPEWDGGYSVEELAAFDQTLP